MNLLHKDSRRLTESGVAATLKHWSQWGRMNTIGAVLELYAPDGNWEPLRYLVHANGPGHVTGEELPKGVTYVQVLQLMVDQVDADTRDGFVVNNPLNRSSSPKPKSTPAANGLLLTKKELRTVLRAINKYGRLNSSEPPASVSTLHLYQAAFAHKCLKAAFAQEERKRYCKLADRYLNELMIGRDG